MAITFQAANPWRLAQAGVAVAVTVAGVLGAATHASAASAAEAVGGESVAQVRAAATAPCPAGDFLGNLQANPANAAYPPPSLVASCTDTQVVVRTNGIPTFPFLAKTPNPLRAQDFTFRIPRVPVEATTPGALNLGTVGVAIDGLPIYGPFESPRDGTADPAADGILDGCGGHAGPAGEYHVHATPACLPTDRLATPGAVVGYALDGYPIVSPVVCADSACTTTRTLRSGWTQVSSARNVWSRYAFNEGAGDLDRCNGRLGEDGQYRYHAVSTFPYFMGCYHGQVGATAKAPSTSGQAQVGPGQGQPTPPAMISGRPPARTTGQPARPAPNAILLPPRPLPAPRPRQ